MRSCLLLGLNAVQHIYSCLNHSISHLNDIRNAVLGVIQTACPNLLLLLCYVSYCDGLVAAATRSEGMKPESNSLNGEGFVVTQRHLPVLCLSCRLRHYGKDSGLPTAIVLDCVSLSTGASGLRSWFGTLHIGKTFISSIWSFFPAQCPSRSVV